LITAGGGIRCWSASATTIDLLTSSGAADLVGDEETTSVVPTDMIPLGIDGPAKHLSDELSLSTMEPLTTGFSKAVDVSISN
jgi:hypothetical protein